MTDKIDVYKRQGSIEATGLKIELIDTEDGKLSRESIGNFHKKFTTEYMTVPKKVYISNTTEAVSYTHLNIKSPLITNFFQENVSKFQAYYTLISHLFQT